MDTSGNDLLEILLRECARAAPAPLYPSQFAAGTSVPRPHVDAALDRLRLGGLVRLTDWVQGLGQGYTVTPEGTELLQSPRLLDRLRHDGVVAQPAPPPLRPAAEVRMSPWDRGEAVRMALLEPRRPVVTVALIFLNLLVFLVGISLALRKVPLKEFLIGTSEKSLAVLHDTGAIQRSDIYPHEQWWRLLSSCFVHIGLLHLAVNMYSLIALGTVLERLWGRVSFLVLYLIAGISGSCVMVAFTDFQSVGAGASGALWGLMASFLGWIYLNRSHLPPQLASAWYRQLGVVIALNVVITFTVPHISAAAHFGGGIAGLVVALPLQWVRFERGMRRLAAFAGLFAVPAVAVALALVSFTPWEKFRARWPNLLGAVGTTFNDYVLGRSADAPWDFFKNPENFLQDKDWVQKTVQQIASTQEQLKIASDLLEQVDAKDSLKAEARRWVAGWTAFFATLRNIFEGREEFGNAVWNRINQEISELAELTRRLKAAMH